MAHSLAQQRSVYDRNTKAQKVWCIGAVKSMYETTELAF